MPIKEVISAPEEIVLNGKVHKLNPPRTFSERECLHITLSELARDPDSQSLKMQTIFLSAAYICIFYPTVVPGANLRATQWRPLVLGEMCYERMRAEGIAIVEIDELGMPLWTANREMLYPREEEVEEEVKNS